MDRFRMDVEAVEQARARVDALAAAPDLLQRLRRRDRVDDETLAAVLLAPSVATEDLVALAAENRPPRLETFSPLYVTNECDAECRMCGMRRMNDELRRETADAGTVEEQLDILHRRGLRAVAVLTGEYRHGARRAAMIARAAAALRAALARDFTHVLINIGSLDDDEYGVLLDGIPRDAGGRVVPQVTMCTFQETYHPGVYARFMGTAAENPRSDYERRLTNFDRAVAAGMWSANPGVLLGLHDDVAFELLALLAHIRHLEAAGLLVYVSLPRLQRASGAPYPAGIDDDTLARLVAVLAIGAPTARVVISTREPAAIQRRLLPMIGVLTPGSPGVAPYTETGARFDLEASQFEVCDHRPIEVILGEVLASGVAVDCYRPAGEV